MKQVSPLHFFCLHNIILSGLFQRYMECYPKPDHIPHNKYYVMISWYARAADHRQCLSRIAGLVSVDDIELSNHLTPREKASGVWRSHLETLFPGKRFLLYREELDKWWRDVEKMFVQSSTKKDLLSARDRFFGCVKKESDTYTNAVKCGIMTVDGQAYMLQLEALRVLSKQAARNVCNILLDDLFIEGITVHPYELNYRIST